MAEEATEQPVDEPSDPMANSTNSAESKEQGHSVDALPPASEVLCKTVYSACYYLSYGVVYSSLLLASAIPMDNVMGAGLRDGAGAARDAVQKWSEDWAARGGEQGAVEKPTN